MVVDVAVGSEVVVINFEQSTCADELSVVNCKQDATEGGSSFFYGPRPAEVCSQAPGGSPIIGCGPHGTWTVGPSLCSEFHCSRLTTEHGLDPHNRQGHSSKQEKKTPRHACIGRIFDIVLFLTDFFF